MDTAFNIDSLLALQTIPHDSEEGRVALEAVARGQLAAAEMSRHPFAVQAFSNVAYLLGNHMVQFFFSPSSGFGIHRFGTHDTNKFDALLAKSADNRLIRAVESVVSMLTSQQPEPRVEPNSELPEDEDAANLAEIALQVVWEKPLNMPQLLRDAALLACTTHLVAAEVEYGETDEPVEIPKYRTVKRPDPLWEEGDPEDAKEIDVEVQSGFETGYRRDVRCRIWSSFNISVDPGATGPHDALWFGRSTIEDRDWIADMYARDEEGFLFDDREELLNALGAENITTSSLYWWGRVKDIIESPQYYGFGLATRETAPNQTLLHVLDVRPSKQYPRGRTLILAGSTLIYAGDARSWSEQYPWRWHPYAFFGWFRVPGRFLRVPLLSLLLPMQKKINAIDALVQANRQYMAFGQYWIPKSCKVQEGRIGGIPGEHYVYTDNGTGIKPERVQNQPLPQELLIERQELVQGIEWHAASYMTPEGQIAPSANRANSMMESVKQERLASKKPMLQDFEQFQETIAQNILIELQLNLINEDQELTQRIRIAAREYSNLTVDEFTGQSLRDHHSVKIDITSGLMNTPEAEAERALQFLQYTAGQVSPPERAAILKAIRMDKLVSNPENASVERARRIVSRIRTGQLEQVFQLPGENAGAMVPVFVDEILSDRFNDLRPEQKELLFQYQQVYAQVVQQQQMQQLQMQMMMAQAGKPPKPAGQGAPAPQ